jgi:hypothetical protein
MGMRINKTLLHLSGNGRFRTPLRRRCCLYLSLIGIPIRDIAAEKVTFRKP